MSWHDFFGDAQYVRKVLLLLCSFACMQKAFMSQMPLKREIANDSKDKRKMQRSRKISSSRKKKKKGRKTDRINQVGPRK